MGETGEVPINVAETAQRPIIAEPAQKVETKKTHKLMQEIILQLASFKKKLNLLIQIKHTHGLPCIMEGFWLKIILG